MIYCICGCPEGEHVDKAKNSVSEGNPCLNSLGDCRGCHDGYIEEKKLSRADMLAVRLLLYEAGMLLADGEDRETRDVLKRIDRWRAKLYAAKRRKRTGDN